MGALVVVLATREPVVEERIVEVPVETRAPAPPVAPDPVVAPAAPEVATPAPVEHVTRPRPRPHHQLQIDMESDDPLVGLDCPEDDPTCGI